MGGGDNNWNLEVDNLWALLEHAMGYFTKWLPYDLCSDCDIPVYFLQSQLLLFLANEHLSKQSTKLKLSTIVID